MAAAQEIGRLIVRLVGDGKQYQAMLVRGATQTKAFAAQVSASMKLAGASISRLGRSLALRVTAPLLIIGALAVNAFAKFDRAMIESTSIMQVTTQQMERMRQTALELSTGGRGPQAPEELAKSFFFLASAGKNAEQSMALLPKVMDFATAGAFDMALATDLLTDAQSALGLTSKNVAQDTENLVRVSDVLVKANTLANASVQQFSTALTSKAAAAMKSFNIPMEEGVAVLAAFADQGIKAELAGNSFSRMMLLMSKASQDNRAAFKRLNFEMFDAQGNVRAMGDIIANLEQSLAGLSPEMKTVELANLGFNARVQGAILPLLGTSNAIKRYTRELKAAAGITGDVAQKQMKAFSNQMRVFRNRIAAVGIEIGKTLAPMIKRISEFIERGLISWKNLSSEVRRLIVLGAILVATLAPVLIIVGAMITAMGALLTPIGAIAAGVALLVVGIAALQVKFGVFSAFVPVIKSLFDIFVSIGKLVGKLASGQFKLLAFQFGLLAKAVSVSLVPGLRIIAATLEKINSIAGKAGGFLSEITVGAVEKTVEDLKKAGGEILEFFGLVIPKAQEVGDITEGSILTAFKSVNVEMQKLVSESKLFGDNLVTAFSKMEEVEEEAEKTTKGFARLITPVTEFVAGINEMMDAQKEINAVKAAESLLEDAGGFGADIHKQLEAQFEADKLAGQMLERLKEQKQILETSAEAVALHKLENDGVNQALVKQVDLAQKALALAEETAKAKKEEARETERARKNAEQLISRFRTPTKEFQDTVADLEDKLSMGLIDKGTFDRALEFAADRFEDLQEMATIQLKILSPREATQLGTIEAERRLAEFREAITQRGKPVLPGPQIPPGPRFVPPRFGAGPEAGRGEPNFAETFEQVEANKNLDLIANLLGKIEQGTQALVEKDPIEFEEVSI